MVQGDSISSPLRASTKGRPGQASVRPLEPCTWILKPFKMAIFVTSCAYWGRWKRPQSHTSTTR